VHLFHGSEVAFYENADKLSTGLMQTVADVPGTEVIFESTANGPGNFFYNLVMGAINHSNGFELIFIPWYWQPEYTDPGANLQLSDLDEEEHRYFEAYKFDGLTLAHLAWRRRKIGAFGGPDYKWKFVQEYPFNPQEAFVKAEGRFFDLARVYMFRGRKVVVPDDAPLIIGIDPGRTGDPTEIARRTGNKVWQIETIPADDGAERDMRLAGRVARIIDRENPDLVVFDVTNEHGAMDRLHELGYSKRVVKGVHFGEKAWTQAGIGTKGLRCIFSFRDWLQEVEGSLAGRPGTYDRDRARCRVRKSSSNNVAYLVSKDEIKKSLGWSPNKLDAVILTFAYPHRKKVGVNCHAEPGTPDESKTV
jgi:hypothetical protein